MRERLYVIDGKLYVYMVVVRVDYAKTLAERLANPKVEDASTDMSFLSNETGPVVNVTVSGVDEVMKKAMEDAQAAMKKATEDHKTAVRVA